MRLFHLTSHTEALHIMAEGFAGARSLEPVCYLLLDSLAAHAPLDPAVAVLEISGDLAVQELGERSLASRSGTYRLFVATAWELARARVRLVDVHPLKGEERRA